MTMYRVIAHVPSNNGVCAAFVPSLCLGSSFSAAELVVAVGAARRHRAVEGKLDGTLELVYCVLLQPLVVVALVKATAVGRVSEEADTGAGRLRYGGHLGRLVIELLLQAVGRHAVCRLDVFDQGLALEEHGGLVGGWTVCHDGLGLLGGRGLLDLVR